MSANPHPALCGHCGLPVGNRGTRHACDGETWSFCCYGCSLAWQVGHGNRTESEATWLLIQLGVGVFLAMNIKLFSMLIYFGAFDDDAHLIPWIHLMLWVLTTPLLVILGWPFARDAWLEARRGQLTANTLMSIGVVAAYGYSVLALAAGADTVYFDTVALLLVLFTLGRLLEASARARAVRSLVPMLEAERQWVSRLDEYGEIARLRLRDVQPGMRLRVLPGERIPVDGRILEGRSHVDEAIVTGEATPVSKGPESTVVSGSINREGSLIVEAAVAGSAGRWAQLCRIVREALATRSPAQRLTDRVAGMFVPFVLALAVAAGLYWSRHLPMQEAMFIGLSVLVVACPCALGLAAPLAGTLGIGGMLRRGIIVRGPEVLERLAQARVVAFDKTGTLTSGYIRLIRIVADDTDEETLLRRLAGLELHSEHPLANAVLRAAEKRGVAPNRVSDARAEPGRGIVGRAPDGSIAAGSAALMREYGYEIPQRLREQVASLEGGGDTVIHVAWAGRWRGMAIFGDSLSDGAAETIRRLQSQGLHCVLLTGDLPAVAGRVAEKVGIHSWRAQCLPEDKLTQVQALARAHGPVVMVGDGLNDGPVLAVADVGVAVGSATDLARETADMVLPSGRLHLLAWSTTWAGRVRRTIYSNLAWAFGYNAIALALAAGGYLGPVWAAVIMAGSSLIVIANSMRLEVGGANEEGCARTVIQPVRVA